MNCILLNKNSKIITNSEQVTHIKKVLKSEVGDVLTVGELGGNLGKATITEINEHEIILANVILNKRPPDKLDLTVILALPRPKVMRRLIMDMTALGVNKIILVNSYRTQKSYWQSPLLARLDEFIFAGLQQAVDTIPPEIEFKKRFKPFVEDEFSELLMEQKETEKDSEEKADSERKQARAVIAHPYASESWQVYLEKARLEKQKSKKASLSSQVMPKVLFIGAEGGWIDYEVDLLCQHGCTAISLGQRILRTEAVVNVLLGSWLTV